jgi:hypothetical protein
VRIFLYHSLPRVNLSWYEPRDHVVTQPTIKIEIWSRKAEIGLIGVWHNGNLPQGSNTIGLSRMTSRSQLIFDKSDSIRSRTEEYKNHSHVKTKKFRSNYHQSCRNFCLLQAMHCSQIRCTSLFILHSRQQLKLLAYGSQLESYFSVLCSWFVVFRHSLNLQNLVSSTTCFLLVL